ncbi:RNA-binding S4 domain-containing protein [Candidatus Epulonipiscium viviparus]|uniref:RNA-binding S4 domain-containing protein n=1 Tax=Candidatus Epulonipiscium viviparus TaxID=420336 RepID=UPI00016C0203|nr:RNA-binding S4 domain-containing protein [Candidatus Epulopiscium viviparus]
MNTIKITTEFIKLDSLLKFSGLVETGGIAKAVIQNELVKVNNTICIQRGKKIRVGDIIEFDGKVLNII